MALQEQALPLGGVTPDRTGKYRTDHLLVAEMIPAGSKVLDVGCGDGELLQLLESRGIDGRGRPFGTPGSTGTCRKRRPGVRSASAACSAAGTDSADTDR